ncbi:hypothetical protein FRC00_007154, partial [Tulasnella sp. 408]
MNVPGTSNKPHLSYTKNLAAVISRRSGSAIGALYIVEPRRSRETREVDSAHEIRLLWCLKLGSDRSTK